MILLVERKKKYFKNLLRKKISYSLLKIIVYMQNVFTKYIISLKDHFQQVVEKEKRNDKILAFLQRREEFS